MIWGRMLAGSTSFFPLCFPAVLSYLLFQGTPGPCNKRSRRSLFGCFAGASTADKVSAGGHEKPDDLVWDGLNDKRTNE